MLNDIYQSIDPVLFAFGPFTVRWYGVAYVLGFVFAGLVIWRVARRWRVRVDADSLLTIMFCVIIGVIVGGRLGYVLFYGEGYYFQHPEQILAFNKGGMSFHGGLIGALLAGIAAAKLTRIPYLTLADLGCIGAPLGLLFGRCANFINGELWGRVDPSFHYTMIFPGSRAEDLALLPTHPEWQSLFDTYGALPRHASQLYELALEGVVLFLILNLFIRKPRPTGSVSGLFLIGYGLFRIIVEFFRQPDAQFTGGWVQYISMGQILSIPMVLAGIIMMVWAYRHRPQPQNS